MVRNGERDVQLSNQMAERAKKKIEGRSSNKFVSTFPAFMWQAEKKAAVSLAGGIAEGGRTNGNTAKCYTQAIQIDKFRDSVLQIVVKTAITAAIAAI